MDDSGDLVLRAYKKLKSFAYYDKNAFYLKSAIIDFEDETKDIDGYLKSIVADFDPEKNTDN